MPATDTKTSIQDYFKLAPDVAGLDLSLLLEEIDRVCLTAFKGIGSFLSEKEDWSSLGWLWGQYRGTVLSGKRGKQDYFAHPALGTPEEQQSLLNLYWTLYGFDSTIGSTIGELFEKRCIANEIDPVSDQFVNGPPHWNVLLMACVPDDHLSMEEQIVSIAGISANLTVLKVPDSWHEKLLPKNSLWYDVTQWLSQTNEQDQVPHELAAAFNRRLAVHLANILWDNQEDEIKAIERFVVGNDLSTSLAPQDRETAIALCLKAIQLFSLYWHWMADRAKTTGPLVVCVPKPGGPPAKLQPRLGFAAAFTKDIGKIEILAKLSEILTPVNTALEFCSVAILSAVKRRVGKVEDQIEKIEKDLAPTVDTNLGRKLIEKLARYQPSGQTSAVLLLDMIRPLLKEVAKILPSMVHEGRRFAATILIGLGYHEQVVGEPLGKVDQFLGSIKFRTPAKCKEGLEPELNDIDLAQVLMRSCYSLFDWEGVCLFGIFSATDKIIFSSFRRISASRQVPGELYTLLTRRNTGLFALNVDHAGIIRVFYGGTLLLQRDRNSWRLGSRVEGLKKMLIESFEKIDLKFDSNSKCLDSYLNLLLRISESPGVGALFVIAREATDSARLSYIKLPAEEMWQNFKPFSSQDQKQMEILYRLSTMDGATVLTLGSGDKPEQRWQNATIQPRCFVTEKFDIDKYFADFWDKGEWKLWPNVYTFGSKHTSALALAMNSAENPSKQLLVITVSADGPISFIVGGPTPIQRWP